MFFMPADIIIFRYAALRDAMPLPFDVDALCACALFVCDESVCMMPREGCVRE